MGNSHASGIHVLIQLLVTGGFNDIFGPADLV